MSARIIPDIERGSVTCDRCNESIAMPSGDLRWVSHVLMGFAEAHENCDGTPRDRCAFASPLPPPRRAALEQALVGGGV